MRIAILAHERFPNEAKTAVGVLRYGDDEVVGVLDREHAGQRVSDHFPEVQDAPIVEEMEDVPECDALLIGIAPIGGAFDESWRPDVRTAIKQGCDVVSGLHYFLGEDEEFYRLADEHAVTVRDIRKPPEDLTVAKGAAGEVDAHVVLTVGTDCSSGKMTASYELRDSARERGYDAAVVPTGQTGIMISGWGIAVDRVISDFAAGATEQLVETASDHDVLFVEGQGALVHPAYSGVTTAILHGSQPDSMALCHVAGRETVNGYESYELPDPTTYAALYESMAAPLCDATVDVGVLNTRTLDSDAADAAIDGYAEELGVPAIDPVRQDTTDIIETVLPE